MKAMPHGLRHGILNGLVVSVLLLAVVVGSLRLDRIGERARLEAREQLAVEAGMAVLETEVEDLAAIARTLAGSSGVRAFLSTRDRDDVESDFTALIRHHRRVSQVRLLDDRGREQVRVQRGPQGVEVVGGADLQGKADRYYVQESRDLAPGEVYLSRLDLNVENGVVEEPAHPVLRVVTATDSGSYVVLNADGTALVGRLSGVQMLVDDQVPGWATGDGQIWEGELLKTWAEQELYGRRLTVLSQRAWPARAWLLPTLVVALPAWALLLVLGALLARYQAAREDAEARLRRLTKLSMSAHEDERREVARWLHDELGQQVTAVALQVERGAAMDDPIRREQAFSAAVDAVGAVLSKVHSLARELRTPVLDDLGLPDALEELARASGKRCDLDLAIDHPVPSAVSEQAYRIAEEAVRNAVRHSSCEQISVRVATGDGFLIVRVADDGAGFVQGMGDGLGLLGMRERAELMGGVLSVNTAPGKGTVVQAKLPLGAT